VIIVGELHLHYTAA